jgi:membrane protease YdiL (CAAX protease family)
MSTPAAPSEQSDESDMSDPSDPSDQTAAVPNRPPGPRVGHALLLSAIFYAVGIAVAIPMVVYYKIADQPIDGMLVTLAGQVIGWPLTLWMGVLIARTTGRASYPVKRFSPRLLPGLLLGGVGGALLLNYVVSLIPMSPSVKSTFSNLVSGNPLILFVAITVAAPIGEELFFRGWMLRGFLSNYSTRGAVLFMAVIFAAFHLNPWQAAAAFPLGVALGWLVLRTGSVVPGMIGHFIYNVSTCYLTGPFLLLLGYPLASIRHMRSLPMEMPAIGIGLCALGLGLLWRETRPSLAAGPPPPAVDNLPAAGVE